MYSNVIDVTGLRFGRLIVLETIGLLPYYKGRRRLWLCLCDCGNIKLSTSASLRSGYIKSCGCLHKEKASDTLRKYRHLGESNRLTHGHSDKPEYYVWLAMKSRCNNPNNKAFSYYGAEALKCVIAGWTSIII